MSIRIIKTASYFLILVILLPVTVVTLNRCKTVYTATGAKWNLSAIYNPTSSKLHPAFKVYHNSDQTSLLLVKIYPSELLFNQANVEGEFISKVSIQVQTYEMTSEKPVLSDSITFSYNINKKNVDKRFLTQIPIKTEMGKKYQLRIVTRDLLRKDLNLTYVDVDKTNELSDQNFNVVNQNGIPYFKNIIPEGAVFRIDHRDNSFKEIFIDYYKNTVPPPKPTYALAADEIFYSKPDSSYTINYSSNLFISFSYEGLYRYRFDTCEEDGLIILNLGKDYPKISTPSEMIRPLAYITTTPEYQKLLEKEDDKLTLDRYWLKIGKNANRSRELIRIYYNRVYFANFYFTSNKPGWETDRGMIYIMYGPPQDMKKTPNSETWMYYKNDPTNLISFTFHYEPNSFTLNNFVLLRSENQEWHWQEVYDSWQRGEIYLSN
jgi:GWxTD domain-containing protein